MKLIVIGLAVVALCACTETPSPPKAARTISPERVAKFKKEMASLPRVTKHDILGNELLVADFTVALNHGFTDTERCYIFRDKEFKTSSMTCETSPATEDVSVPDMSDSHPYK